MINGKEEWIVGYINNLDGIKAVDMLDEDFVDKFIQQFNAKHQATLIGAYRCNELSRLLGKMYKNGLLVRYPMGLRSGAYQDGFPKWIYCYEVYN